MPTASHPAPNVPVHLRAVADRRQDRRVEVELPVRVDGSETTTQDLSASGLSFTSERAYSLGARIPIVVEYLLDGHQYPLACDAEVVRVDHADDGFVIGARLLLDSSASTDREVR
jgi:hypothetical protein